MKFNLEELGVVDTEALNNKIINLSVVNTQKDLEIKSLKSSAFSNSSNQSSTLEISNLKFEIQKHKDLLAVKDAQINNLTVENSKLQEQLRTRDMKDLLIVNNLKIEIQQAEKELKTLKEQNKELKDDKNFLKNIIEKKSMKIISVSKDKLLESKFSEDKKFEEALQNKIAQSSIISKENTVFSQSMSEQNSLFEDNLEIKKPVEIVELNVQPLNVEVLGETSEYIVLN